MYSVAGSDLRRSPLLCRGKNSCLLANAKPAGHRWLGGPALTDQNPQLGQQNLRLQITPCSDPELQKQSSLALPPLPCNSSLPPAETSCQA